MEGLKYLSDYIEDKHDALMKRLGAFYAFNKFQFKDHAVEGVKYSHLGAGMIVPKDKSKELIDGISNIIDEGIAQDKKDHTAEQIILRELENHEAYYTGCIDDTVDKLKDYGDGFKEEDIRKVYTKTHRERKIQ